MAINSQSKLQAGIRALEAQRAQLGDAVVDMALEPLRARLAALQGAPAAAEASVTSVTSVAATARAVTAQTLRQVCVLFLDVVGSTALSQHLDPEDIHQVVDGVLQRCSEIVLAQGGKVLQYAGDSMLAVFGADEAREDDAERAVRCGLALLAVGRELGERVLRDHGHASCDVRVGIHTGPVLLGGGVDKDGSIRGMTVNLAARMEQTAPAGGLRISRETWRHVEGLFDTEVQAPLLVKGRDAAMTTYLVRAALPEAQVRPARAIEGVSPPMLGRAAELAQLLDGLQHVRARQQPQAFTVLAEAGLGKSRLLHELLQHVDAQGGLPRLLARAHPGTQLQPYRMLRDMLATRLQIVDSDSVTLALDTFTRGLAPYLGAEADAHLLGQLIGLDFSASPHLVAVDPRQLRDRALAAFQRLLQGLAAEGGGVVLLLADDLHWADDASLDLLQHLMSSVLPLPLLLVAGARPALLERRAGWATGVAGHALLALQPLADIDSQALADALLQRLSPPSAALRALLLNQSAGNPYYMEELLKMLIDDGIIAIDGSQWRLRDDAWTALRVPSTLAGVLQARLDALDAGERSALQQASIVGTVFWDDALAALDDAAPGALPALQRRALVRPREHSAFDGTTEEAFRHDLLHQVAYATVLKPQRRQGHAVTAAWLAARVSHRSGEHLATTATHYLQAGDGPQAARWLAEAAEHAVGRFDNATALAHVKTAMTQVSADDIELRFRLARCAVKAADTHADRAAQEAATAALEALAVLPHAPRLWAAHAPYARALLQVRMGRLDASLSQAAQAAAVAAEVGDANLGAQAHNLWMAALRLRGDNTEARVRGQAGLALARAAGDVAKLTEIRLLSNLSTLDHDTGRYETAVLGMVECLELAQRHHQAEVQALLLSNLSACHLGLGDYSAALDWADQAHAHGLQVGDHLQTTLAALNRGDACFGLGRLDEALASLEQADTELQAIGALQYHADALVLLGDIRLARDDAAAAAQAFERAHAPHLALGNPRHALNASAGLACARLRQGDTAGAMAALQPVLQAVEAIDPTAETPPAFSRVLWLGHLVLQAVDDARAPGWLEAAHRMLQTQAARIDDPARRQHFLATHLDARVIVPAWNAALEAG